MRIVQRQCNLGSFISFTFVNSFLRRVETIVADKLTVAIYCDSCVGPAYTRFVEEYGDAAVTKSEVPYSE